jgi:hypothetical protein
MKATVVDLRYRMNEILRALARNEDVSILCHGRLKGVIRSKSESPSMKAREHPFFNMLGSSGSVDEQMAVLRESRVRAV